MSRPPRKLIFHIGDRKTGSTTIQNALATGRILVDGRKPFYPASMAHNYILKHFNAYAEGAKILKNNPGRPNLEKISQLLEHEEYAYAVISGEKFEEAKPNVAKSVMEKFLLPHANQHSVICYIRPHAARTLSSFAEQTKIGSYSGDVLGFHRRAIKKNRFKYEQRLRLWTDEFEDKFIARPFVRDVLTNGSPIDDFNKYAFPDSEVEIEQSEAANESLCLEDLVFLRYIQGHLKTRSRPLRLGLGWNLALDLTANHRKNQSTKLRLDRHTAEVIRKHYLTDARELDRTIFASSPVMVRELDRAVDTALPEPQSMNPSDYYDSETLRYLAAVIDLVDKMLDNNNGRWASYLHEHRVDQLHRS